MTDAPPPNPPIRAVTFDLDGLMFNTEKLYQQVGTTVLARRGKQASGELFNQMMGRKSNVALQIMIDWHDLNITVDELAAESAEVMGGLLAEQLEPMPGLLELLDALEAAGVPKGIATSSGRGFVDRVLDQSRVGPRMDFSLTSEDIEHGKPAPDVYLLAAERHGVEPAAMLVLEDSQIGCAAAVAAGAYAVAVPAGQSVQHDFAGAAFEAQSLADARIYAALGLPPRR